MNTTEHAEDERTLLAQVEHLCALLGDGTLRELIAGATPEQLDQAQQLLDVDGLVTIDRKACCLRFTSGAERFSRRIAEQAAALDAGEPERTGMDELRLLVRNFSHCSVAFNDRHSAEQLLQLHRMMLASGWFVPPEEWEPRQLAEALAGKVPRFRNGGVAVYDEPAAAGEGKG